MLSSPALIQSGTFASRTEKIKLQCIVLSATLVACLGPLSFGFTLSYPSPVEGQIDKCFAWNGTQFTWFSAIPGLTAIIGSNIGGYSIENYGRKLTIMLCSVPFVAGWVMIAAAKIPTLLYVGRAITGLGVGAVSVTVPVYIAEISPANFRGTLGCGNQLAVTLGSLFSYGFGAWTAVIDWRWLAIIGAILPTLMVVLMTIMPETPRWLIKQGRSAEALRVVHQLRGGIYEDSEQECREIQNTLGTTKRPSLAEFKTPNVYRPLLLAVLLMLFQQFSGINVVVSYASELLKKAGYGHPERVSIIIAAVQVVVTGISCLVVDKFGRRVLLIVPGILMAASMALLGATQYSTQLPKSVFLVSLILYVGGFSLGWGPIPWLIMSEIFPTRVRGVCSSIVTLVNWLGVFVVTKTYDEIKAGLCDYGAYWLYATVCLLSAIYVFFFLPETKGLSLEKTEELFCDSADVQ